MSAIFIGRRYPGSFAAAYVDAVRYPEEAP